MARDSLAQLREATAHSPDPPSPTESSDKENPSHRSSHKRTTSKMAPGNASSSSKRRRLAERSTNAQSQAILSPHNDTRKYYDPDQDEQERRQTRSAFRELTTAFNSMLTSLPPI